MHDILRAGDIAFIAHDHRYHVQGGWDDAKGGLAMSFISRLNRDPHRPVQVTYAVILLYGFLIFSLVLWFISTAVNFSWSVEQDLSLLQLVLTAFYYFVLFILTSQIAAGKNWARWLLIVGSIFSLLNSIGVMPGLLVMIELIVLVLSVSLLFQPASSEWFKSEKSDKEKDLDNEDFQDSAAGQVDQDMAIESGVEKARDSTQILTLIWMLITQAFSVFFIVPWFFLLGFAAEAGGLAWETFSIVEIIGTLAIALLLIHPITAIVFSVISWFLFIKKRYGWAALVTSFSILPFILYMLAGSVFTVLAS